MSFHKTADTFTYLTRICSINKGVDSGDSLGWKWSPLNGGKPIASGAAPASQVVFGDIDG